MMDLYNNQKFTGYVCANCGETSRGGYKGSGTCYSCNDNKDGIRMVWTKPIPAYLIKEPTHD